MFLSSFIFYWYLHSYIFTLGNFVKYSDAANQILKGKMSNSRLLDFSALYLYLHIFCFTFFPDADFVVKSLHILCTSGSGVFLFLLLKERFSLALSCIGAFLFFLSDHTLVYFSIAEPEPIFVFLLMGFLYFITAKQSFRPFLSGCLFGLAFCIRPSFFLLTFIIPIYIYTIKIPPRKIMCCIYFFIPVLTAMVCICARNAAVDGKFTPFFMNPGAVIYEGNNPGAKGNIAVPPPLMQAYCATGPDRNHVIYRMIPSIIYQRDYGVREANAFWLTRTTNFVVDYPVLFLKKVFIKSYMLLHNYMHHDLQIGFLNEIKMKDSNVPYLPFFVISFIGVIGVFCHIRNIKEDLPLYFLLFNQCGLMILTYTSARQRFTLLPFLVFFGVATLNFFLKKTYFFFILIISFAVFSPFLLAKNYIINEEEYFTEKSIVENLQNYLEDARQHITNYQFSQALDSISNYLIYSGWTIDIPRLPLLPFSRSEIVDHTLCFYKQKNFSSNSFKLDKAILLLNDGRLEQSSLILKKLIQKNVKFYRKNHCSSEPLYYLGKIAVRRNNIDQAHVYLKKALQRTPGDIFTLSMLYALTKQKSYYKQLLRYHDAIAVNFFVGVAALECENTCLAVKRLQYISSKIPAFPLGQIYYAVALGKAGYDDQAVAIFFQVFERDPLQLVFLEDEIMKIFETWYKKQSDRCWANYFFGIVNRQFGHFKAAKKLQKRALIFDPVNNAIVNEITVLDRLISEL